jgi:hypothetical protein
MKGLIQYYITFHFRGEFYLTDWLTKIGNYNIDYMYSYFRTEGYFDKYNNWTDLSDANKKKIVEYRRQGIEEKDGKHIYEMILIPNDPFLNENKNLPPGVELQLSFDRLNAEFSVLKINESDEETLKGKVLTLKNVFAQVEYVSSPVLRNFSDQINNKPIAYVYDECTVLYKSLPLGEQQIRIDNIRGGNTPDFIFIGIMDTVGFAGSSSSASIRCQNFGVNEINITLNGNSCHGYPIKVRNDFPLWPYVKFQDVLGSTLNSTLGNQIQMEQFMNQMLFAHKFEGEESHQGWIGVTLSLDKSFDTAKTLGFKYLFIK